MSSAFRPELRHAFMAGETKGGLPFYKVVWVRGTVRKVAGAACKPLHRLVFHGFSKAVFQVGMAFQAKLSGLLFQVECEIAGMGIMADKALTIGKWIVLLDVCSGLEPLMTAQTEIASTKSFMQ